jgi:hypothetical protein
MTVTVFSLNAHESKITCNYQISNDDVVEEEKEPRSSSDNEDETAEKDE